MNHERGAPRHILTILAVTDLAAAARLYERAFGWPRAVDVPVYVELELPEGRRLGLYEREAFSRNTGVTPIQAQAGEITGAEVYLHCEEPAEVAVRLVEAGARRLSALAPRPWGDEAAYFTDLDGNVLVVARALEA